MNDKKRLDWIENRLRRHHEMDLFCYGPENFQLETDGYDYEGIGKTLRATIDDAIKAGKRE